MRRTKRRSKEIRVGIIILLALAIMISAVFFIGGQKKLFGGKVNYNILFNSTGGLYQGDPVLLTGVEVGNVVGIGFPEALDTKKILVEISVLKEVGPRIREDTRARVGSASLVYGKVIELSMGSFDEPVIPEGGFIESEEGTSYGAFVDSANLMVDDIRGILSKFDQGEGMVGMLLNEPLELRQTLHHLSVSSRQLAGLMEGLDQGKGPLGVLLSDSVEFYQALEDIKKTTADLGEVSNNLKGKESVVGKLINDKEYGNALMKDLQSAVHSLANITAKVDTGRGTLGSLVNDNEIFIGLQDVVLGVKSNKVARWLIQNRRKAGEKERLKQSQEGQKKEDK